MSLLIRVDLPTPEEPIRTYVSAGRSRAAQGLEPRLVKGRHGQDLGAGQRFPDPIDGGGGLGQKIRLVEQDDRLRPALADHDHLPLQAADVEVEVQPLDQDDDVDVGGQDLLFRPPSRGMAGQAGASRQDGMDDGLALGRIVRDGDPVADLGKVGRRFGFELETAGDFGRALAPVADQDVGFPVLDRHPGEVQALFTMGGGRLFAAGVPAVGAQRVGGGGGHGGNVGHGRAQKPRKLVLSRRGRPDLGVRLRTTYWMPRSSQNSRFSGRSPSSLTR